MERISVTVVFCVALIVGIILQAPPQVYRNVSAYYGRLGKGQPSVQATNPAPRPPVRKNRTRKPAGSRIEELNTASFDPFDEDSMSPQKTKSSKDEIESAGKRGTAQK
jgi:hypothetical protein